MSDLKGFLRNVLVNFCDHVDIEYPPIRMSDLNTSTTSTWSNDCSKNQVHVSVDQRRFSICSAVSEQLLNNSKLNNDIQPEQQLDQTHNETKRIEEKDDKPLDENDNKIEPKKPLTLMIPRTSFRIVNDITKIQTPDVKRNSTQIIFPLEDGDDISNDKQNHMVITRENPIMNDGTNKQKQIRPIMGKNALLKKANIDRSDSLIVQDIVLDKYNPVLNHYVSKMYHRRQSRTRLNSSCDEDSFSEGPFSSTASCSPMSLSSVNSDHQGFIFPSIEEVDSYQSDFQNLSQLRVNRCQRTESFKNAITDNVFVESPNSDYRTSASVISNEGTTFSDYDPEKFLKNALGDIASLSESGICNQIPQRHTSTTYGDSSVGSADVSMLVSKLTELYSTLKKGIRKRRSSLKNNHFTTNGEQHQVTEKVNPYLNNLKKELAIQNEITFQVSKALVYCRSSKDFLYSAEHVEAEKILLVALITKEVLISEINTIEFNNYQNTDDPRNRGEIEISSIKFVPNENCHYVTNETDKDMIKEFFLVVLSCGGKVIASKVITSDEKGCLEVDKSFVFKNLSADFEISLAVYSMLVKDKAHLSQETVNCPSPKNIFHFHKESKKSYKVVNEVPYIKTSAFRLLGRCCIRNAELSKTKYQSLVLHDSPVHSTLSPSFTAKITSKTHLNVKINGFLTVGVENEQSCTIWNRRWCVLENSNLKYWNYPSEETSVPLGIVDLTYCIEQKISLAGRSSCARPRTLLVPIKSNNSFKKYLLSTDSTKDMEMWEKELNFVIRNLATWKCMN